MESLDYWRLCDQLSVIQAALLVVDCDPSSTATYVESWEPEKRPPGYEAAKTAISNAMRSGQIAGKIARLTQTIWSPFDETYHEEEIEDSIDASESRVEVASLKSWLADRGFTDGFFFPGSAAAPDYLDTSHPRYAPKLAAAILAWRAAERESLSGRSPKQALVKWLREHAAEFGRSDEDGKPNETGIEETAKVGRPRRPWLNLPTR